MGYCSWKCFATGLLIGTLCFITISMIGGLVAIPVIYVRCTTDDHHQYSIVYAAAPDRADLVLYRWDSRKKSHNTAVFAEPFYSCHVSDGVDLAGVSHRLKYCLQLRLICSDNNGNKLCLPGRDKTSVPFYFLATRELYSSYGSGNYTAEVDEYSNNVTKTMADSLNSDNSHIITLTESEESIATWITGNVEHLQQPDKHSSTFRVLYLGAASVQLSYETDGQTGSYSSSLDLYGKNHSIYSDTRWCNGSDEIWKNITINANFSGGEHSCLPRGYNWTVNDTYLSSLCTNTSAEGKKYTFQGIGNRDQCEQLIDSLIVMQQDSSTPHGKYIAVGKFVEVMKFFNTTDLNNSAGWETYNETLQQFCEHNWTMMNMQYNGTTTTQLYRKCYEGILMRSLLMKAYGFTGFTNKSTWSISQGSDTGNAWSLGYMLEETQNLTSTSPHKERPYSKTSLILSLVELVILLVLFSMFLISVIHVSCSDKNKNGYIAIS